MCGISRIARTHTPMNKQYSTVHTLTHTHTQRERELVACLWLQQCQSLFGQWKMASALYECCMYKVPRQPRSLTARLSRLPSLPLTSLAFQCHFHLALVLFQFPAVAQENRTAALNSCTSRQANVDPLHAHLAALYLCACLASVRRVA